MCRGGSTSEQAQLRHQSQLIPADQVIADIFRSRDLGGWAKAGWLVFELADLHDCGAISDADNQRSKDKVLSGTGS